MSVQGNNNNFESFKKRYHENEKEFYNNLPPNSMYSHSFVVNAFNNQLSKNNINMRKLKFIMNGESKTLNKNYLGSKLLNSIKKNKTKAAEALINLGAPMNVRDRNGKTLLELAKEHKSSNKVINALQKRNNEIKKRIRERKNANFKKLINNLEGKSPQGLQNWVKKMSKQQKNLLNEMQNKIPKKIKNILKNNI